MVRAKFKVRNMVHSQDGIEINLDPVTHGSPENEQFYKFTPYGSIQLGVVNEDASSKFSPGQEFYVDFTPVAPELSRAQASA